VAKPKKRKTVARIVLNTVLREDDKTCILVWTDATGLEHRIKCPVIVGPDGVPGIDLTYDAIPDALNKELNDGNVEIYAELVETEVPASGEYYCLAREH
jgi:hypothetical protein